MRYKVQHTVRLPSTGEQHTVVLGTFDRRDYADNLVRAMARHGTRCTVVEETVRTEATA